MQQLRATYSHALRGYRHRVAGNAPVFDAVVGAVIGVIGLAESRWLGASLAAVGLAMALAFRRRAPLLVFLAAFGIISAFANDIAFAAFLGVLVAGYTLAAYGRWPVLSFAVMFAAAVFVTVVFHSDLNFLPQSSTGFLILGTLWLAGSAIRVRQRRADELEERARTREREQDDERQIALARQRAEIARELHDVVTHSVSVMVIQAGAARHVMERRPEKAVEALLAIEARGREALAELRGFLGVLDGATEDDLALVPQPGTADLEALISGVAETGLPVRLEILGTRRELPHGVDLAAYRVVQEALTNAIKYAGGSPTEVVVEFRADELAVEVLDEGPGTADTSAGATRGLVGLRERLAVHGGRLEAGRRPSGGFAVRAWIPTGAPAP
ncbi:MAG: sensor histidine kinase [Candidatus Dormibacteria bacterium]